MSKMTVKQIIKGNVAINKILKRPNNTFLMFLTATSTIVLPIPCHRIDASLDHKAVTNESILTSLSLCPFLFNTRTRSKSSWIASFTTL
jgi:hypothetical protein